MNDALAAALPFLGLLAPLAGSPGARGGEELELGPAARRAIALLRDSRLPDAPATEDTVEALSLVAAASFDDLAGVLVERRLPPLTEGQAPQTLSIPQRAMILDAVADLDPALVRSRVEGLLDGRDDDAARAAAVDLRAAAGEARDLAWMVAVLKPAQSPAPGPLALEAYERGLQRLLGRDPRAYEAAAEIWRRGERELLPGLVRAIGAAGDPAGLPLLLKVATWDAQLAPLAIGQVRHVGPAEDRAVNRAFGDLLRRRLEGDDAGQRRMAMVALAELGDFNALPKLLDVLEEEDGLERDALWSLRHLTGMHFAEAPRWRRWYAAELRWFDEEYPRVVYDLHSLDPARSLAAARVMAQHRLRRHELATELARALDGALRVHRTTLCAGLEALGSERGVPSLVRTLEDPRPEVRAAAVQALRTITGESLPADAEPGRRELGLEP